MNSERCWRRIAAAGLATALAPGAFAAPQGPVVTSGTAVVTQTGKQTDIKVSNIAVLQWGSFNIANGEGVHFDQPSRASVVWNFINDNSASQILGSLSANGFVILLNQNGFLFGPNSVVNVGGLVVTTGRPVPGFTEGNQWTFTGMPPTASIVNYGNIKVSDNSSLFLIAEKVENHGILQAPDGTLGLYSGKEVLISERPDGRGLSAKVTLPSGSVDNRGALIADGGLVAAAAQVVNVDGLVQANSIRERNGVIELTAEDSITLGANAEISAKGGSDGVSAGGSVTIKSGGSYQDDPAARITVAGGSQGGNGGSLEISAPRFNGLNAQLSGGASMGYQGGSVFIDPDKILINQTGDAPDGTLGYNIKKDFLGFQSIHLQADSDITVDTRGVWNVAASSGAVPTDQSQLFLESGGNLTVKDSSIIKAGDGWSIKLAAGSKDGKLTGSGSITVGGDSSNASSRAGIQASNQSIDLEAANNITVGNGSVTTTAGGSILAHAALGDIKTGFVPDSYLFNTTTLPGYRISASLGGISTAAGGDVTMTADKGSVYADAQGVANNQVPGSSGAFGSLGGNVTITAGKNVSGTFTLANGTGKITAGADVGVDHSGTSEGIDLQLIKGGWTVTAGHDLYVNEVRNPSGTFNKTVLTVPSLGKVSYYNDYDKDAYASFSGNHEVILQTVQGTLPRITSGGDNTDLAPVFPPILNITAGAGGVYMPTPDTGHGLALNELVLFPSEHGFLSVTTSGGGGLHADPDGIARIIESDGAQYANNAGRPDAPDGKYLSYYDFTYAQASLAHREPPVHADTSGKSVLSIDGSMSEVQVSFAQKADVTIGGNLYNAGLFYRQYAGTDASTLTVGGTITYTSAEAKVALDAPPNLAAFAIAQLGGGFRPDIFQRLVWNAATKELVWIGTMSEEQRDYLLNPVIPVIDPRTQLPEVVNGQIVTTPTVLVADSQKIRDLYANSLQTHAPEGAAISISGPGSLVIHSKSIDLGASDGIFSTAPDKALQDLPSAGKAGASIDLTVLGNLELTSSRISSEAEGANLSITVIGGGVDVGSQDSLLSTKQTGIFTTGSGNISITADKDINVNGSRVATFRGGNIALKSLEGNIDAGQGGVGSLEVDGKIFQVSGIISLALADSTSAPGDIAVDAVKGNFTANKGGVFQAALNGHHLQSSISINAGGDIDAGDSGVVGGSVAANAGGKLKGNFFGSGAVTLTAQQSISANAIGQTVSASSAQGNVSGTIIGGAVNVSGVTVDAAVISANATVAGNSAGAQVGTQAASGNTGPARTEQTTDQTVARASSKDEGDEDERKRRLAGSPKLARTVGRVTVVLPSPSKTQ